MKAWDLFEKYIRKNFLIAKVLITLSTPKGMLWSFLCIPQSFLRSLSFWTSWWLLIPAFLENQSKLWLQKRNSENLNKNLLEIQFEASLHDSSAVESHKFSALRTSIWEHMLGFSATSSLFQVIVLVISDEQKYRREFISKRRTRRHDNEKAFSANNMKEFFFVARGNSDEMSLLRKKKCSQSAASWPKSWF